MPLVTASLRLEDAPDDAGEAQSVARKIYYGWVMLGVSIVALAASSPGQTYGVSIFNEPMRQSLGLSHSELASAYMLGTLLAAVPLIWLGSLMDRYGLRRALFVATLAFLGACWLTASAQSWLMLMVAFFGLRLIGPGALAFLSGNILPHWFHRRLGFVEGLRQLGMAIAMACIPSLNLWLVSQVGWRGAYATLGTTVAVLLLPVSIFIFRNRPEDVGQMIDGQNPIPEGVPEVATSSRILPDFTLSDVMRMPSFWIVTAGVAWFGLAQTAVFFSMVPMFLDRSLTQQDAANLMATFAGTLAVMHVVSGHLADRWSSRVLLGCGMAGFCVSMLCLYLMQSSELAIVSGALMGSSQGLYFGASHPLWARYYGRLHLGKIRGALMTIAVASSSIGPLIAGLVRDNTGSFDLALVGFSLVSAPLAILCAWVTAPASKAECDN